jgi:hypothetical protein
VENRKSVRGKEEISEWKLEIGGTTKKKREPPKKKESIGGTKKEGIE